MRGGCLLPRQARPSPPAPQLPLPQWGQLRGRFRTTSQEPQCSAGGWMAFQSSSVVICWVTHPLSAALLSRSCFPLASQVNGGDLPNAPAHSTLSPVLPLGRPQGRQLSLEGIGGPMKTLSSHFNTEKGPGLYLQNQSRVSSWCDDSGVRELLVSHTTPPQ